MLNWALNQPAFQNLPEAEVIRTLIATGDPRVGAVSMGLGTYITQDQFKSYMQASAKDIDPYYKTEKDVTQKRLEGDVSNVQEQYAGNVEALNQSLMAAKEQQDSDEGVQGTWASSARQERLNSLANKYNLQYRNLYNQAKNSLGNTLTEANYNLGEGSIPSTNVQQFGTNLSQTSPAQVSSLETYKYNPFQTAGNLAKNQYTSTQTRARDLMARDYYNPFKNIKSGL
jgi:hypothetical protein